MNKKVNKHIAVTGSSGFIGSVLTKTLKDKGYNISEISRQKGVYITEWDNIKDYSNVDVIVHLAGKLFVPDSFENPRDFYQVNFISTLNALELARKNGAKFIFLSSYIYGPPKEIPVFEEHSLNPHNPYAQTKLICEKACEGYCRDFDMNVTIFRPFNIYGPGQSKNFLIPTIIDNASQGNITLKDPRPKRDYIHVKDVAGAILKEIESDKQGFTTYNLGTGKSYSVEEVVSLVKKFSKINVEVNYTHEYRKGEVLDSVADISKIKKELGWEPDYDLKRGIQSFFED